MKLTCIRRMRPRAAAEASRRPFRHLPPARRGFAAVASCAAALVAAGCPLGERVDPTELGGVELARRLAAGELTAEQTASAYLERIAALDRTGPSLRAVLEVNPDALAIARALDRQFREAGPAGPLHGVPVILKGNIDTADRMATSAGSVALAGHFAAEDAPLVRRLREAGAVILGKANLSEWANFRSLRSVSGWSSVGGQTRNPYVLDRNPCGSSSGSAVAVAARLAPLAVGTETDGSIVCPAGANGVVGLKPTIGRVDTEGIVPIAASQDTAGPLARSVADAALLLRVLLGEPTRHGEVLPVPGATSAAPLAGVTIGVVRDYTGAGEEPIDAALAGALEHLRAAGAVLVDPIRIGAEPAIRAAELEVLLYEFKDGIERYLANVRNGPRSLEELIRFNEEHAAETMPYFGQEIFLAAAAKGSLDEPAYARAVDASRTRLRALLAERFAEHGLDLLVAPANGPAWRTDPQAGDRVSVSSSSFAAISGYPSIAVPVALVGALPVAVALVAPPHREELLLSVAAELERRRGAFPEPEFLPAMP